MVEEAENDNNNDSSLLIEFKLENLQWSNWTNQKQENKIYIRWKWKMKWSNKKIRYLSQLSDTRHRVYCLQNLNKNKTNIKSLFEKLW